MKTFLLLIAGLAVSCSSYNLSTDSLLDQLNEKKELEGPSPYNTLVKYTSNNLDKIKCINKKGLEVWLTIDRNTRIILIKKSGLKAQGYFDTVILRGDTLYAIESRISGGRQKILLKDIDRVVIKSEFAETKVAK